MSPNPYAAPEPRDPYRPARPVRGEPQPWEPGEVLEVAWAIFKPNWLVMSLAALVWLVLGTVPGELPAILREAGAVDERTSRLLAIPLSVGGVLVSQFLQAGLVRMTVDASRTGVVSFSQLFGGGNGRFLAFLGVSLLNGLAVGLGLLCLVVPGIVLAFGLSLSTYYVVDQELGPIEAMKASWETTMGHKGRIFAFGLLGALVGLAGMMACCVGYFAAAAVVHIGQAVIYLRLSGTAAGPSAIGGQGPGGYGPPPPPGVNLPPGLWPGF